MPKDFITEENRMKKEKRKIAFELAGKAGNCLLKTASAAGKAALKTAETAGKLLYSGAEKCADKLGQMDRKDRILLGCAAACVTGLPIFLTAPGRAGRRQKRRRLRRLVLRIRRFLRIWQKR